MINGRHGVYQIGDALARSTNASAIIFITKRHRAKPDNVASVKAQPPRLNRRPYRKPK